MEGIKGNVVKTSEEFDWKISDFFSLSTEVGDWYNSSTFLFAGDLWYLSYFPNMKKADDTEAYIGLFLSRHVTGPPVTLKFSICLKSLKGEKIQEKYLNENFRKSGNGWGAPLCMSRSELIARKSELLPSDVLTVTCTIKCTNYAESKSEKVNSQMTRTQCSYCKDSLDPESISTHEKKCLDKPIKCSECSDIIVLRNWYEHECQKPKPKVESCTLASSSLFRENKLFHDLKNFFLKKENCDVVMRVKGQEFSAHKAILEARSPVLASTFRNDMKEKVTGVVDIEDCDPSSFSDFLCFVYCGDTGVISKENVFSLFTAADKYDVQDLRETCVMFMKKNLSVDTFCETITLALRHSEADLINLTTDFFIKNAKEITLTVKWQTFLAENPTQSNELIVKFIASLAIN